MRTDVNLTARALCLSHHERTQCRDMTEPLLRRAAVSEPYSTPHNIEAIDWLLSFCLDV